MKRFAIILLLGVLLAGCGSGAVEKSVPVDLSQTLFECHAIDGDYAILVDVETKVCYLEYKHAQRCGITVMLNADGMPKLWEE